MEKDPKQVLRTVFGYETFKPFQQPVIENVLGRRDTLAIMPTGSGKSICYQIPALIFSGLTIVVSPLISLMKDQVEQLLELDVPAIYLNSSLSIDAYQKNLSQVIKEQVKLLYVSPEALLNPRLLSMLSKVCVDCIAIDEAHCVSQWGHDFRPEYRQLVKVRQYFPAAVIIALTATATPRVCEDIRDCLGFMTADEFIGSFNRKNLFLEVMPKVDGVQQTIDFINRFPNQSGIVYCFTRSQVDEVTRILKSEGYKARAYHAGMDSAERISNQDAFIHDDVEIIVATIAFGMGINKPNVRFVMHFDIPKSVESYYQEIGRSGRDGLNAHCLLLYSGADAHKIRNIIDVHEKPASKKKARFRLQAMVDYAESNFCRRIPLLNHFGEKYPGRHCGMCDNCQAKDRQLVDITIPAQMFLSCVKRTDELFGASHVIDVLRGSNKERVLNLSHNKLSTYGIGREYSRKQWKTIGLQLLQAGLLVRDPEYGGMKLTPKSYEWLRSGKLFYGVLADTETTPVVHNLGAAGKGEQAYDKVLFERLRAVRKQLADDAGIPPYTIFQDRTLIELAIYYPASLENMDRIFGIGSVKLEKYGKIFLNEISIYCRERGLEERINPRMPPEPKTIIDKPRYIQVGELYKKGRTVDEIEEFFGVTWRTVIQNLHRFIMDGNPLNPDGLLFLLSLDKTHLKKITSAFEELGYERLRPIFDRFEGKYRYDDLYLCRLIYLMNIME